VIAVICAGMALVSSLSRWLLVLLAIPAIPACALVFGGPFVLLGGPYSAVFRLATTFLPLGLVMVTLAYLLPLILLVLAVVAARHESLRSSQALPASSTR
jgi:hypothetical protein